MGRPLYTSILLARCATEAAAQPAAPKPTYPVVEKWSRWNAFDPDSDEFFQADDAVYEAFLSEAEIAERTQAQHRENARLLAERLLREANTSPSASPISEDSDLSVVGNDAADAPISVTAQMEVNDEMFDEDLRSPDEVREAQESSPRQPPARHPRRAPSITRFQVVSTGETRISVPRISVVPAGSREVENVSSPDPSDLVSGLQHLSESPRPLVPVDSPSRPISPIPNSPARVSGVFVTASSPASTRTPAYTWRSSAGGWGEPIQLTPEWVPESSTPQDTSHFVGPVIPSTPAPLTY